jgi:hypothetical protein
MCVVRISFKKKSSKTIQKVSNAEWNRSSTKIRLKNDK